MKIRSNYVSNSSSSSFVIYNWFDLTEDKRNYIKDYDKNALQVWKNNNIPFRKPSWKDTNELVFDDEDAWNQTFGNESIPEQLEDEKYDKLIQFAFGFIFNECIWYFQENQKRNTCLVTTSMNNFNMEAWLKYNKVDFDEIN